MMISLGSTNTVIDLVIYFILLVMILTCTMAKLPIKITSVLWIWTLKCVILPMDIELMDGHCCMREGDTWQYLSNSPNQGLVLTHYMLSAGWIQLLVVLGHYVIHYTEDKQVTVMTASLLDLGTSSSERGHIFRPWFVSFSTWVVCILN